MSLLCISLSGDNECKQHLLPTSQCRLPSITLNLGLQTQMQDGLLVEGKLQEYLHAFEAVDTGNNGLINASEIQQLFENLGQPLKANELVRIMEEYDVDRYMPALKTRKSPTWPCVLLGNVLAILLAQIEHHAMSCSTLAVHLPA